MEEQDLIFHDITDTSRFTPEAPFPWLLAILIVGAFISIAFLIYFIVKSKKTTVIHQNQFQLALDELKKLKPQLESLTIGETAENLSYILRNALLGIDSPSLYKTQQEAHLQKSIMLSNKENEKKVKAHLDELWNLEYAPSKSDLEKSNSLFDDTHSLLSLLKDS